MSKITERLNTLRQKMQQAGIAACIIPSSDPHLGEFVAGHWKRREWISGFDGLAGTVVVLKEQAGLWTDSRYFIQAELQLDGSGISLFKEGVSGIPDYFLWITTNLNAGETIGIDGEVFSTCEAEEMQKKAKAAGLELKTDVVLINEKWANIPAFPENKTLIYDEKWAGMSVRKKIDLIRQHLKTAGANMLLLTALDEIAWTFNIYGTDVEYNPLTVAYSMITTDSVNIFIDEKKIMPEVTSYFEKNGIKISPYSNIFDFLSNINHQHRILVDKQKVNFALYSAIPPSVCIIEDESPVALLKAIKNEVEIQGVKNAMIKDGVALTHAFYWLEKALEAGQKITEISFADKLKTCRAEQKDFFCESFRTICGYGANGAIVHYSATPESDSELTPDNLFLIDSGANYFDGTTDITRTIIVGKPTKEQKQNYTHVLKGHIALASVKFPEGSRGVQLDVLARQFLWSERLNYGHGTGHGVGHFLCVHEGPQNIRVKDNGVELKPGMLLSNEPGIYCKNRYGIRLENIILVKEYGETEFGRFLEFETLSLFPFDSDLIEADMLSEKELEWITDYHQMVYQKLSPFLPEKEKKWLKIKTNLTCKSPPRRKFIEFI